MKKFSKILTLILSLAVILTAFTVIAFATDENTLAPKEIKSSTGAFIDGTFSAYTPDTVFQNAVSGGNPKTGVWNVHSTEDGNVYLQSEYDVGGSGAHDNLDMYFGFDDKNNIVAYPYIVFDMDIMSENGTFGAYASISTTLIHKNLGNTRVDMNSVYLYDIGLDATPYKWQHLTYIVEHKGDAKFEFHFYVNGEHTLTKPYDYSENKGVTAVGGDASKLALYFFRMYPSIHNTASGNGKIGYDNFRYTLFPAGYCDTENGADLSKIATYYYNESYKLPYGLTEAKVGDSVYDDVQKAINEAAEGATVKLVMNATKTLVIDKNILIDTNVYSESGEATGSFYTYTYKSSKGFVPTETAVGSGIFSFEKSPNAVDIIWDEACGDNCDCFADYGGHKLTASTVAILGNTPEYFGSIPTWDVTNDYTQKFFLGWSYENDGTVDELVPITAEDVARGTIKLYPVYTTVKYDLEVIVSGASTFYFEKDFDSIINSLKEETTIKLLSDIYTETPKVNLKKSLTIDLNGYSLKRCFVYGNVYEATKNGDDFVYATDTVSESVESSGDIFFQYYASGISLTFTSSTGSGTFYNLKMSADTWKYEGEVVKRVSSSATMAPVTNAKESTKSTSNISITMNGGITVYAGQLFYSLYASGTGYSINVDNIKYYKLDNTDFIYSRTNYKIDISITDSLIYTPSNGGYLMFLGTSDNKTYGPEHYSEILVKNCDIIKAGTGWGLYLYNTRYAGTTNAVFDNCRLYDAGAENTAACDAEVTGINGTLGHYKTDTNQESTPVNPADGWTQEVVSFRYTYYVPAETLTLTDGLINTPTFDFPANVKHTITFNRIITKPIDVNWIGADGRTVKTEKLTPGIDALIGPKASVELPDDDYRNLAAIWVDAAENGKAITETLGWDNDSGIFTWQDTYNFYAVGELDGNKTYVGGIKNAMFNISFLTSFKYNVYFPVNDVLAITSVEGFEDRGTVSIDAEKYKLYNFAVGTTAATEDLEVNVAFTVNGEAYEQIFKLSAVRYADMILAISDVETERLAVGNMIRFLKEARLYSKLDVEERLDDIIADAGVPDYAEKYDGNTNIAILDQYIYSVSYVIYNGCVSYKFVLNDPAYADVIKFYNGDEEIGFKIGGTQIYTIGESSVEKTFIILNVMRVYDIIDTLTIKVEGTELSATYSMLDNIEALPHLTLAKALYEFGLAADKYKDYLEA